MNARLAIFDCDGVLVDSEPIANRLFAEALREVGLELSYDEVCRRFVGLSLTRCLELVETELGRSLPADFTTRLQHRTFDAFRDALRPVPGIAQALERIALPTCVASSGRLEKMRLTLGLTGLLPRFEGRLFSASMVERSKPAPDLFLFAASRMDVEPADCVVVEDSRPGVVAAIAAGMRALGYAAPDDPYDLAGAGARVFHAMTDLPDLIG